MEFSCLDCFTTSGSLFGGLTAFGVCKSRHAYGIALGKSYTAVVPLVYGLYRAFLAWRLGTYYG